MTAAEQEFLNNPLGKDTTLEDVLDGFEFLDDWEERYAFIIDLGKQLPAFPDDERREENYVHGCQSQVWLIHHYDEQSGKLYLLIDSDAIIVRGLAAIIPGGPEWQVSQGPAGHGHRRAVRATGSVPPHLAHTGQRPESHGWQNPGCGCGNRRSVIEQPYQTIATSSRCILISPPKTGMLPLLKSG